MAKRHRDVNSVLKDPQTSKWLKQALTSALDCDAGEVKRDVATLFLLMQHYVPVVASLPPRKQWPPKIKSRNVIPIKRKLRLISGD